MWMQSVYIYAKVLVRTKRARMADINFPEDVPHSQMVPRIFLLSGAPRRSTCRPRKLCVRDVAHLQVDYDQEIMFGVRCTRILSEPRIIKRSIQLSAPSSSCRPGKRLDTTGQGVRDNPFHSRSVSEEKNPNSYQCYRHGWLSPYGIPSGSRIPPGMPMD